MIYPVRCRECGHEEEIICSMAARSELVDNYRCSSCGSDDTFQVLSFKMTFVRSGFPKGRRYWEHLFPDPPDIRSKEHLRDECDKHGVVSKLIEDGT